MSATLCVVTNATLSMKMGSSVETTSSLPISEPKSLYTFPEDQDLKRFPHGMKAVARLRAASDSHCVQARATALRESKKQNLLKGKRLKSKSHGHLRVLHESQVARCSPYPYRVQINVEDLRKALQPSSPCHRPVRRIHSNTFRSSSQSLVQDLMAQTLPSTSVPIPMKIHPADLQSKSRGINLNLKLKRKLSKLSVRINQSLASPASSTVEWPATWEEALPIKKQRSHKVLFWKKAA